MNQAKTFFLLTTLTVLFVIVGNLIGGQSGMIIALVLAGLMNLVTYFFSDRIVLALYRARELSEAEAPELFAMVRRLAQRGNLPMPRVYLIPTPTPNAFATGRDPHHSAVAVTEGILATLDRAELEGVIGHELAHIKNRDTLIMTVAATIAGAIAFLANMARWSLWLGGMGDDSRDRGGNPLGLILLLVALIVVPIAATLIQLAISRAREFLADEGGARLTGNPLALASALRKLEAVNTYHPMESAEPATANLFIVNPFGAEAGEWFINWLRTHPPTEARIARLMALARGEAPLG
ncbi:MAG: zinc metalloprotease HtpX [Armatimonadetes bacterium]|nr:zinc metalloprotease HtpX [Armatimonadota bacterium]MDW8122178.1 zinc metalloprotease HtpX [Armatimonadota bacterium]